MTLEVNGGFLRFFAADTGLLITNGDMDAVRRPPGESWPVEPGVVPQGACNCHPSTTNKFRTTPAGASI